jgi:hypothetical protein
MIHRNQRFFCFTDWQTQHLKRIDHSLRKLNLDALDELRDVGRTTLTHAEYQKRAEHLTTVAIRMNSAVRVRKDILASGREQDVQKVVVIYVPSCDNCAENGLPEKPDSDENALREAGEPDPTYQKEIEVLLDLTLRTEERLWVPWKSRRAPPQALFVAISRMTSAVLRQQQLLRSTALKRAPDVEFIDNDFCPQCNSQPENELQYGLTMHESAR